MKWTLKPLQQVYFMTLRRYPLQNMTLVEKFGEDIAILIDGVTKIGKLKFKSKIEEETENFRRWFLHGERREVVLVKLADRTQRPAQ